MISFSRVHTLYSETKEITAHVVEEFNVRHDLDSLNFVS